MASTEKSVKLTSHEIEVLKMLAGTRDFEWGAWVSACLEHLSGAGLCTGSPNYAINAAGRLALAQSEGE